MPRMFHLSDVLSITTGRLVATRHIDGVYDILNYMTGESLFTHQLPRASEACAPALKGQHPQLADLAGDGVNETNWRAWLDEQIARYGEILPVEPLLPNAYRAMDPIAEAAAIVGHDRVIVVSREEN